MPKLRPRCFWRAASTSMVGMSSRATMRPFSATRSGSTRIERAISADSSAIASDSGVNFRRSTTFKPYCSASAAVMVRSFTTPCSMRISPIFAAPFCCASSAAATSSDDASPYSTRMSPSNRPECCGGANSVCAGSPAATSRASSSSGAPILVAPRRIFICPCPARCPTVMFGSRRTPPTAHGLRTRSIARGRLLQLALPGLCCVSRSRDREGCCRYEAAGIG